MKIQLSKIVFSVLSYLSDKTRGNAICVKYKLLIGTFLLSATQATAQDNVQIKEHDRIRNERVTCYKVAAPKIEISGKVISSTSNTPLKEVKIALKGTHYFTETDQNGEYKVEVRSKGMLVFSCDRYLDFEMSVNDLQNRDPQTPIVMMPEIKLVQPITCYMQTMPKK